MEANTSADGPGAEEMAGIPGSSRPARGPLGNAWPSRLALDGEAGSERDSQVVEAEFLVCPGGLCVPTEGALRVEEVLGVHYVIGRSTFERCASRRDAERRLASRIAGLDPHELVSEVLCEDEPPETPGRG